MLDHRESVDVEYAYREALAYIDTHTQWPEKKSFTERITEKYTLALILIGLILIITNIGLFLIIETYETSAEAINIAGRQRMYSQWIAKIAHDLMHEEKKETPRKKLLKITALMEKSHEELADEESELNSRGNLSPAVKMIYFEAPIHLDRQVRSFLAAAKRLAAEPDNLLAHGNPYMDIVQAGAEGELLQSLDLAVRQYQDDSELAVYKLQLFAATTLALLLLSLIMAGRFIFLPMTRYIQKEADAVADSEQRLRDITSSLGEGVIVSDKKGRLVFMNPAAERLLGWTEGELRGKNFEQTIHSKRNANPSQAMDFELYKSMKKNETIRVQEDSFTRKDGSVIPVSFVTTPIRDKESISGAVLAFHDIWTRKKAEEERRKHSEKMESALYRAEDVLNLLSKPPTLVPFFVTSPVYRYTSTIGGGDVVRWLNFRSRYAGVYLHDVSGHDIQEILLNILAAAIVDNHKINPAKKAVSLPSVFFNEMNKELLEFCSNTSHYVTAIYSLMDFETREITISLAGHLKPWLITPYGGASQVGKHGFMLGQFEIDPVGDERYQDTLIKLESGQTLLIFSDGLMEQVNDQDVPFEQKFRAEVVDNLKGLEINEAHDHLKIEFEAHLGGKKPDDDVSFIFIGTRPTEKYETDEFVPSRRLLVSMIEHKNYTYSIKHEIEPQPADIRVENDSRFNHKVISEVSESFTAILNKLSSAGWVENRIEEAGIALREIVTNSIIHGNLNSEKYVIKIKHILHRDVLEVSVSDEGVGFDSTALPQSVDKLDILKESGRGHIMANMYANNVFFNENGNTCWLIFRKAGK